MNSMKERFYKSLERNPYRLLALSFFSVMFIGGLLLCLPISSASYTYTSITDAFFTSVSCVSVTGLSVVDTYYHWSLFGKIVMVLLIQLGGLGIVTFSTFIIFLFGGRIGLRQRLVLSQDLGNDGVTGIVTILKRVTWFTLIAELIGGTIYVIQLYPYLGQSALYIGYMQSVSTFCNAGFVFFNNTLPLNMVGDWLFTLNTTLMIIIGGFGYIALFDLWEHRKRCRFSDLHLHTKLMIVSTASLLIIGFVLFLALEWSNPETLGPLSITTKIQAAWFQAVTPRTAGLNTLNYGGMHPITLFITIIFMFIGTGPNSTGGGVKTTTVWISFLAARTLFNQRPDVEVHGRRLSPIIVNKAQGIILLSLSVILLGTCYLSWVEELDFIRLLFEVTSAFGTVGLSTGITTLLSDSSKWVLMVIMFTGRVGVMTAIGTWALRTKATPPISYPEESVLL